MRRAINTALAQFAQAGVTFFGTLVFANTLSAEGFGTYAALFAVGMILLAATRAILGEQLIAAGMERRGYSDFVLLAGLVGLVALVPAILVFLGPILAAAATYTIGLIVSDAVRYGTFADSHASGSQRLTSVIDGTRLGAILVAFYLSTIIDIPSVVAPLVAMLTSVAWPAVALVRRGLPSARRAGEYLRTLGAFERAMALQFTIGTGAAQAIPFVAIGAFGLVEFGALRLAQGLVAPVALVATAFAPGIIAKISASHSHRDQELWTSRLLFVAVGAAVGVATISVIVLGLLGPLLVPADTWPTVAELIVPTVVGAAMVLVGLPGGALIRVRRYASVAIVGQSVGVAVGWLIALLASHLDVYAFAWALVAGSVATVVASYVLLGARVIRDRRRGRSDNS